MLFDVLVGFTHTGYIAGTQDGIVTVGGVPAVREITVMHAKTLHIVQKAYSMPNGHYLLTNLDPTQEYLIMARDYKREYEPCVWDYVTPATDLTADEQRELWTLWQS